MYRTTQFINTYIPGSFLISDCLEALAYEVSRALEYTLDAIEHTLARRAHKQERRARMAMMNQEVRCAAANFSSSSSVC
jgi:hypothetical protein